MPAARRPYDASRRQDAARRKRAAILGAFDDLLAGDGYQATTIRVVAEHAGVSPETVYKTFGGKPGLAKALWDVTLAGDDESLPMAERPALQEVWRTRDPHAKLRLYAAFVRGVHERLASLFTVLSQAGPEAATVLADSEAERLAGVTAFVTHLGAQGVLRPGLSIAQAADACWALTGPQLFTQLTAHRGWPPGTYQDWLAGILAATLLDTA
ncbi:MAG TPA: TetR/AcrR family transcriptional regulator [Trebonia sp.]|nr:TetR/AcrR family transcriptional regulator [Trebonia sp.]